MISLLNFFKQGRQLLMSTTFFNDGCEYATASSVEELDNLLSINTDVRGWDAYGYVFISEWTPLTNKPF